MYGICRSGYFNPLSPCGERHLRHYVLPVVLDISIHSPRAGRDAYYACAIDSLGRFQSTLPVWGETLTGTPISNGQLEFQSTLLVRGETIRPFGGVSRLIHFNPLSPCGERLVMAKVLDHSTLFQSTLPVWGETPLTRPI